jgi:hypothetical protein
MEMNITENGTFSDWPYAWHNTLRRKYLDALSGEVFGPIVPTLKFINKSIRKFIKY